MWNESMNFSIAVPDLAFVLFTGLLLLRAVGGVFHEPIILKFVLICYNLRYKIIWFFKTKCFFIYEKIFTMKNF